MHGIYEVKTSRDGRTYRHRLKAYSYDHAATRTEAVQKCRPQDIRAIKFIREI